jgi:hypothetical protein
MSDSKLRIIKGEVASIGKSSVQVNDSNNDGDEVS